MSKQIAELKPSKTTPHIQNIPLQTWFTGDDVAESRASGMAALSFRVARALELVESEYGVPQLNLDVISRRLGVTKSHLCRIFRREVGIGLPEYVRRMRAQKAEKLLRETVLSIKEITAAVGFAYVTQLDRTFKAAYGCTPQEYRKRSCQVTYPSETGTAVKCGIGMVLGER